MGIITKVEVQKKNKKRANIFIDDCYFCSLETVAVASNRLKAGDEVDEGYIQRLQSESDAAAAFDKSVGYLSVRRRTRHEIMVYLNEKGFSQPIIDQTIKKLGEYKYIDDQAFAQSYISTYKTRYGRQKLKLELSRLGVDEHTIADAMEDLGSQLEQAIALAHKYKNSKAQKFDKRKLFAHLYSKGFDADTIREAIEAVTEE